MNADIKENPMGTDGFEFLEFTSPNPEALHSLFKTLGFNATAKHQSKHITLYQQGDIRFLVNAEPNAAAGQFAQLHGPSTCGMAFKVKDAQFAFKRAVSLGAKPCENLMFNELGLPAIYGIGDSLLYFVDANLVQHFYQNDFVPIAGKQIITTHGLTYLDHVTHNVNRGCMNHWADFYIELFNFHQIRYFDISGKHTGLLSRAMTSPCGKIRIPLNEASDDKSQIQEFINEFKGEGIQHIALGSDDIYASVESLRTQNINFLDVPDTYYEMLDERIPWHQEDLKRLNKNYILMDGEKTPEKGLLLQIFTQTMLGPAFFEIIQRKGNEGFGEGNFQALFESIERDQIKRGVI